MNDVYVAAATVSYVEKAFVAAHQFRMINFGALFALLAWELSRLPSSRFLVESCYGLIKTLQRRPCNSSFRAPLKVLNSIDKCVSNVRVTRAIFPYFRSSRTIRQWRSQGRIHISSILSHILKYERDTFHPRKSDPSSEKVEEGERTRKNIGTCFGWIRAQ